MVSAQIQCADTCISYYVSKHVLNNFCFVVSATLWRYILQQNGRNNLQVQGKTNVKQFHNLRLNIILKNRVSTYAYTSFTTCIKSVYKNDFDTCRYQVAIQCKYYD